MSLSSPVFLLQPPERVDSKKGRHRGPLHGDRVLSQEVVETKNTREEAPICYRPLFPSCSGLLNACILKKGFIGDTLTWPLSSPPKGIKAHVLMLEDHTPLSSPASLHQPPGCVDSKQGRHQGPSPGGRFLPWEVLRTINKCEKTPCRYRRLSPCPGLLKTWTTKMGVIGDLFFGAGFSPGRHQGP
jgi:hypothetical protein